MTSRPVVDVSALMSVYAGVDPAHVALALDSIAAQTVSLREAVVVVDGPVSDEHRRVLADHPELHLVELPENVGSGRALAAGLTHCTSEWVARFDADDLSEPDRIARQLDRLTASGADVCTAALVEFEGAPDQVVGVRRSPTDHGEFARLMPTRNPVNHPAVVFRRATAVRAGGYQHLPYHEDYDLWARMLVAGAVFTGCPEPLVRFRADGMQERRARPEALDAEREQQRRLVTYGLIGPTRARLNLAVRTMYLRLPPRLMELAYRRIFRVRGGAAAG